MSDDKVKKNMIGIVVSKSELPKKGGNGVYYKYKINANGNELTVNDFGDQSKKPIVFQDLHINHNYNIEYTESTYTIEGKEITSKVMGYAEEIEVNEPHKQAEFTPAKEYKKETADTQTLIVRQSCLKVASELVKLRYQNTLVEKKDDIVAESIEIAKRLEQEYVMI